MAVTSDELLKRPLYVFDLPHELLVTLHLKDSTASQHSVELESRHASDLGSQGDKFKQESISSKTSTSCVLCLASFQNVQDQRHHVKSDWHGYNLKQKIKGLALVTENEFENLVENLDESISGSESSESENDDEAKESTLSALLKKQAKLIHGGPDLDLAPKKRKRGSGKPPLLWFSTSLLAPNTSLGFYRAIFTDAELEEESQILSTIRKRQLPPVPSKPRVESSNNGVPLPSTMTSPHIFLCMIGGGHFAAMIVSLAPKMGKKSTGVEERQAIVIAHKTFHRYTTRRKQGGSQSSNDSAKGAAHSAGASIRRYNEVALETDIRALLAEWKDMINNSQLIFVRATGSSNRRMLYGPYDGQVLRHNDSRNRTFPFSTRRATQAELMRAFVEITRVKVSHIDEAALAAAETVEAERIEKLAKPIAVPSKPAAQKPSKEEEAAALHTSQLQALIRRSKAPAVLSYLSSNSLSPDFIFHPPNAQSNHHAPTSLHLASSINSSIVVLALLSKAGANPSTLNSEGKAPFDLTGERATRDAFRVARSELGEDRWDWSSAHCPPPLTKAEADKREERERLEVEKAEAERRKVEIERLKKESLQNGDAWQGKKVTGKPLGVAEKTGEERREEEARGLTPEMRTRLERERRARAAEERIRRMTGGVGGGGAGR
ncbi:hypothetical protein MMC12_005271 [Toensbergia leucococca]|nr:hypothetical protein [Toensbergia leucococca]